jgi:isopenicillin-N epimerase
MSPKSPYAAHWSLDPAVVFLNHGSFGACPTAVLERQQELRARMEREPVLFLHRELEPLLDAARAALGAFVGANPDDLAFVHNATTGVNTVLRALDLRPADEIVVTDQEYNATRNAVDAAATRAGARTVVVTVPFPLRSTDGFEHTMLAAITPRTRLVVVDHVTSQTGLIVPVERIVRALRERGVETLVDGAHAPGMLPLDLDTLGAAYYTGNCHKWICAPKGSAFLHVRRDLQAGIRPLVTSHGANSPRTDRTRFRIEMDWTGTGDPTAWLCVPTAIAFMQGLCTGGWPEVRSRNRELVLHGRALLCRLLRIEPPCSETMIGSLASVPLPPAALDTFQPPLWIDDLQRRLWERERIEVPVMFWPAPPSRLLRISAQLYNDEHQYETLARAVAGHLGLA